MSVAILLGVSDFVFDVVLIGCFVGLLLIRYDISKTHELLKDIRDLLRQRER